MNAQESIIRSTDRERENLDIRSSGLDPGRYSSAGDRARAGWDRTRPTRDEDDRRVSTKLTQGRSPRSMGQKCPEWAGNATDVTNTGYGYVPRRHRRIQAFGSSRFKQTEDTEKGKRHGGLRTK